MLTGKPVNILSIIGFWTTKKNSYILITTYNRWPNRKCLSIEVPVFSGVKNWCLRTPGIGMSIIYWLIPWYMSGENLKINNDSNPTGLPPMRLMVPASVDVKKLVSTLNLSPIRSENLKNKIYYFLSRIVSTNDNYKLNRDTNGYLIKRVSVFSFMPERCQRIISDDKVHPHMHGPQWWVFIYG